MVRRLAYLFLCLGGLSALHADGGSGKAVFETYWDMVRKAVIVEGEGGRRVDALAQAKGIVRPFGREGQARVG